MMTTVVLVATVTAADAGPAPGAPGGLDPSFGLSDRATRTAGFAVASPGVAFRGVAVQPDGGILAVGDTGGSAPVLAVQRFTASGRPDTTFGAGGVARLPAPPEIGTGVGGTAIALQPDGRIVVSGTVRQNGAAAGMFVARLLPGGTTDPSFSGDGIAVALGGATQEASADAVAIAPGGQVVIAGRGRDDRSIPRVALARLRSDGTLDGGFRGGGADLMTEVGLRGADAAGIAVRTDGRIVLAGAIQPDIFNTTQALVLQTDAGGRLDGSFAGGGQVVMALSRNAATSRFNALTLAPDGAVIAVGSGARANVADGVVVRLRPDGSTDTGFGIDGRTYLPAGQDTATVGPEPYPGYFGVMATATRVYAGGGVDAAGPFRISALSALSITGTVDLGFGAPVDPAYAAAVPFTASSGTAYAFADEAGGRPFQGDAAQITGLARTPAGDVAAVGIVSTRIGARGSSSAPTGYVAVHRGAPEPVAPPPGPGPPTPPTPTTPDAPSTPAPGPGPPTTSVVPGGAVPVVPAPVRPPALRPPAAPASTPVPRLTRTDLTPRTIRVRGAARLHFSSSAAGTVRLSVLERRLGRVRGGRCRPTTTATRRSRSCTYEVAVDGTRDLRVAAGTRTLRITRRVAGRTLRRGSYRLVLSVTSGGVRSASTTLAFRVR